MTKLLKITGIVAALVAIVAVAGATSAFAQGPAHSDGIAPRGGSQMQHESAGGMGLLAVDEDAMHEAIAAALSMSVEELEAALAAGTTPFDLAQEQGIDFAVVEAAMEAVHQDALQQAVNDGLISQEQADWMLSRQGGQNSDGSGMNRGANGSPQGGRSRIVPNGNSGDCVYQAS